MKKEKYKEISLPSPWKRLALITLAFGAMYYGSKHYAEDFPRENKPSKEVYTEQIAPDNPSTRRNYKGYDVIKGIDKNGSKSLQLRDGFSTRLERPTTLIWRGDSIEFYQGKDMGRGIHLEDSTHYFKSLNKDSLERIFKELK